MESNMNQTSEHGLAVGDEVMVGEFFWVPDESIIGLDADWQHGHGAKDGSADTDCSVEIRGFEGGDAIVRLNRPVVPYGALAPIGLVFSIPIKQILSWTDKREKIRAREKSRRAKARIYCK